MDSGMLGTFSGHIVHIAVVALVSFVAWHVQVAAWRPNDV